jgi:hypothetical protein
MVVLTTKGLRPPTPHRVGFSTTMARGATFQQLSYVHGLGAVSVDTESYAPFTGGDAQALKKKYGHYGYSAQACINRALQEEPIRTGITQSTGTAPELVVLGDALLRGLVLGRTLFFQSKTFRDPVFNPSGRVFSVDILKIPFGDSWLQPVDGTFYHFSTLEQEIRDADRNQELAQYGHVLPISDQFCQTRGDLTSYLEARGSP